MGVRLQRLVLLAGWLALVPVAAQAETALSLVEVAQPSDQAVDLAQAATPITGVRVEPEGEGLRLVLDAAGALAEPTTEVVGNALVAEISNAVLALPEGESFEQFGPAEGIALVSVTSLEDNRVRVSITGNDGPPAVNVSAGAAGLVLAIVPGLGLASGDDDAIRIGVTGEGDEGYAPRNSSTATRTDTPLRDVPQSIQVIPRAVIEDRSVTELGDTLETAGSVVSAGGRGISVFGPGFLIRGFANRGGIYRDGIQSFSLAPLSTNDIERVEILRGPASVLFGQGEPGGIINLVSKQPLSEPRYEVGASVGSYDNYRGNLDLSGPLSEDRSVRYRLNLSYENYGSFRDLVNGERLLVSPTLTWDIGPSTSLNFYGQYAHDRETTDEGIPFTADGPLNVPRSRFVGEDFAEFSQDQFTLGYRLDHDFSDNWSLRHSTQYLQFSPQRVAAFYDSVDEVTGDIDRTEFFADGNYRRLFTNVETVGRFNTGSIGHQVLIGAEYRNVLEQPGFRTGGLPYPSINIFNPVYAGVPFPRETNFFRDDTINTIGIYAQDQVDLLPNLKLLAGLRYDSSDQFRTTQRLGQDRVEFTQTDSAFSPRLGIVYEPIEPISLYASYTRSFSPSFGAARNSDGSTFRPETGQQFEIGTKVDVTDTLSFNLALFDIRRQNVRNPDPNDRTLSIQTGEVASRGLELGLGGEILPGWNLTANYTLLDAFVSRDTRPTVGNQLANVSQNQFSLWSSYEIQEGSLQGLGAGLGLFYLDQRPGDLDNSFTLPSYFRTDAALFYRRDNWRAQLNVENLFNINYFTSSDEFQFANPGAPFTVTARVAVEF
ncbi:MAG: TonB-dependent siderophore receptor [Shackletoniella antarctica]|uniref:TonB-dependent siderophore receptor n=1 Tax=Shackletoniella antarctica TaxID=268115 RepID=A0A2W4XKW1_9CYAN|nr:MAG: TonB-dependent siderophore receptor [Shackletoniella antarctica]